MALTNIFKKEKKEPKEEIEKSDLANLRKEKDLRKEKKEDRAKASSILKAPHITEKATNLVKQNQYVFKVFPEANKIEIKKAIENLYDVEVLDVKIINIPAKRRRLGRISGWRKGYKKAIVKIKEGQKIEIMPR